MSTRFNVLISSAGRRVALLRLFRQALADLGLDGSIVATDVSPLAAAWQEADVRCLVPRCDAADYIEQLTRICADHDVKVIVPTIDTELAILATHRTHFARRGVTVLVGSPDCVEIAGSKRCTNVWLDAHGFPTVRQTSVDDALANPHEWPLPVIAKPSRGSSSIGLVRVRDREMLEQLRGHADYVVESIASGDEYTVDVLLDTSGRAVCAVPRRRIEVRGGEVSKGVTVRDAAIEALACRLGERLPGAYGCINVQLFRADDGRLAVVEINARFGGGFPLSAHAGANYPRWILEELSGAAKTARQDSWKHNVAMLRYDAEVFVDYEDAMVGGR